MPPESITIRESPSLFAHFVLGVTPHPSQARFLECRAPVKVAACGRRWGKSTAAALDTIHLAVVGDGDGKPTEQMIVAPTSDQASIIFSEVARLLTTGPLSTVVQTVTHSPFDELLLSNGSIIRARSAAHDGRYLRGRGAHRVVADEAAFISERTIQEAILPTLADTAGQLVLISTPFGASGIFAEAFSRGQDGLHGHESFQCPSHENPHISAAFIEEQRQSMTDLQFRAEWLAQFVDDQSSVFKWALIQRATEGELEEPVAGKRYVLGWDPAKYHDKSALIIIDCSVKPRHVVAVETIEGRDYSLQVRRVAALAQAYHNAPIHMDCTGNAALLEQMQAAMGHREVRGFAFTNASKQELIDGLVLALEHGEITFPAVPGLLQELRYYQYVLTKAGNVQLGAPDRTGHFDDLVTALALADHLARRQLPALAPLGIPKASMWANANDLHGTDHLASRTPPTPGW